MFLLTAKYCQTANATAISIALPTIGRDLDIAENKLQWLVSAYSLSSVSTWPPDFYVAIDVFLG